MHGTARKPESDLAGDAVELADAITSAIANAVNDYRRRKPCLATSTVVAAHRILLDRAAGLVKLTEQLAADPDDTERLTAILSDAKALTESIQNRGDGTQ